MTPHDAEYWAKRFRQLEETEHDKSSQYVYENVEKQFALAAKELEKEITAWVQRFAEDNALSMAEARKLLTTKELQEFKWTVEDYIKHGEENKLSGDWTKQLRNALARVHVTRLDSLKLQMQQHLESLYGNQVDMLDRHLQETYADSYYHTAYEVAKGQEVAVQMNRIDNARLASIVSKPWVQDGKTFSDRLWRDKDTLNNVLQEQLSQAVIRGEPLGNITKNVRDRMGVATSSAARLVSTESAFFATAAQQKCFSFLGVKEYEFVATLDDRTSEICQDMDGKHFKLTEMKPGTNAPPMHCNCRSCIAPYFDDAKDSARAARNLETGKTETVPADMTYPEWKKVYVKKEMSIQNWARKRDMDLIQDVSREYKKMASPGIGLVTRQEGYSESKHRDEIAMAQLMHDTFGGDIELIKEDRRPGVLSPDYEWHGAFWDLKTLESENAADKAIRHGIKQIMDNPGGVVIQYFKDLDIEKMIKIIADRLSRSKIKMDVIIFKDKEVKKIIRYAKKR